ncbi:MULTISPECIES: hypothetical protein [Streptomyces]|uniref:Uncharacterized protein n=1 Tax=Streptomyces eurythermus TaxID=42237 RepID=A0ABW6Z7F7_9ACTN|nr:MULTISPECIES: hypothetical protein [Streptomyces]QIS68845.1 hypothetical protein HB370_01535 [Streptomyces sp. DSM 40868]
MICQRATRLLWLRALTALLLAFLTAGTAVPTAAADDKRPPGSAEGMDLSRQYDNPLLSPPLRPVLELRVAVGHILPKADKELAWDPRRNGAVEYFNPLRLTDRQIEQLLGETTSLSFTGSQAWRTSTVEVDRMDGFLERAVVEELRKHHVERLIAVSALNNPRRLHAEQMIQRVRKRLHIPDDARIYGASERQQCAARCALLYPPDMPTGFGRAYGLTVWETARMEQLVARARKDAAVSGPKAQDRAERHVRSQLEELERTRNASTREKLQLDLEEARKVSKSWERQVLSHSLFASAEPACPRPSALGQHLSVPGGDAKSPALVLAAADVECDEDKATSGDADSTASADASGTDDAIGATGLGATLTNPGLGNGGIDFSTMKLSYLADPGDGSGLQYSFNADLNPLRGDVRQSTGVAAATQSSDAFFVWLALNPQHFWVNLSPDEPDRIVDGQLGRTDAGRVLLEADLQMKKTVAKLTHPHTTLGKRYWDGIRGDCVSSRNWIVPAPASVYQDGDKLYILDAPLDVKMETEYVVASGDSADTPTCPKQDQATEDHNEHLDRTLILPRLRKAINTAPEYAALRRVHLARVAAEWYRELSTTKDTTYGELVDSGDITDWRITGDWKPRDTFDKYVESYTKGEYKVTDRTTRGGTTYVRRYVYGGVDFTSVPVRKVSDSAFAADFGTIPASVDRSLRTPSVTGPDNTVWLGAPTPRQAATGIEPAEKPVSAGSWAIRLLPILIAPLALLLLRRRRRLTTLSSSPLRRAAMGWPPRRK